MAVRRLATAALACAVLAALAALPARARADGAREQLAAALARYRGLLEAEASDSIAALFAPDGVMLNPGMEPLRGPAAIRAFLEPIAKTARIEHEALTADDTEVFGRTALAWCSYAQTVSVGGGQPVEYRGRVLIEWRRIGDAWLVERMFGQPFPPPRRSP